MTYSLIIEKENCDPVYRNGILTWEVVTSILRNNLPNNTIRVQIYKWSSNNKCLGHKCVRMNNITDVVLSLRDKEVLI
jgi:hypothetical protein